MKTQERIAAINKLSLLAFCAFTATALSGNTHAAEGSSGQPAQFVVLSASASAGSSYDVHTAPYPGQEGQQVSAFANYLDPDNLTTSAGAASAAGFGWLRSNAQAGVSSETPIGSTTIHRKAGIGAQTGLDQNNVGAQYFKDAFTIETPGVNAQDKVAGIAHVSLKFYALTPATLAGPNIGAAAQEGAYAQVEAQFEAGNNPASLNKIWFNQITTLSGTQSSSSLQVVDNGNLTYEGQPLGSYVAHLDIPFIFGQPVNIHSWSQSTASAGVSEPLLPHDDPAYPFIRYAQAGAQMELTWGGISSVTLAPAAPAQLGKGTAGLMAATSNEVTNFSVTSVSGADYLHAITPVPEPDAYAMLLAGLGLVGLIGRLIRAKHV